MFLWSLSVKKKDLAMEHHVFPTDGVDFQFTQYIYCCCNSAVVEQLYPKSWGYLVFIALISLSACFFLVRMI